ncbi:MAG TPA: FAD-binding oxidoreductase [Chloroflexi bacterium]|nr:FAD-binding oxidoreductase [Chloroflexota bacterium]
MPNDKTANVVICGAGIAGIATAYHLSVERGVKNVTLIDERPPLSLTSDKSTEAYRNWWPGPGNAMVSLMNRSIDLLEDMARQSDNRILLNRRGYLYATGNPQRAEIYKQAAAEISRLGAGQVRFHTGSSDDPSYIPAAPHDFEDQPNGADVFLDQELIRQRFPYLSERTVAVLHARRCGWFSGQQLGMMMLEEARAQGVQFISGRVEDVDARNNCVQGVRVRTEQGAERIAADIFINAAGPLVNEVGAMLGLELPVFNELHLKLNFSDHLKVIPRDAPMVIWEDAQKLNWSMEEVDFLVEDPEMRWLLGKFPSGIHLRPEGHGESQAVLMLWDYHKEPVPPIIPPPDDPDYPEVVLRGLTTVVPALQAYLNRMPKPMIDGGYYTKTKENRPLIGPLPVDGAYIISALSGYGLMAAPAAGELLASHIAGDALPDYAPAFLLSRYEDPAYQQMLENWGDVGQL